MSQTEQSGKSNHEYFELLKCRKNVLEGNQVVLSEGLSEFFEEFHDLEVGEKLAEGGQAEIYEATWRGYNYILKVFKEGSVLPDLEKQCPPALVHYHPYENCSRHATPLTGATLLKDAKLLDRFALVMPWRWGELRKLIGQQMMQSYNQGPGLPRGQALILMGQIVYQLNRLHTLPPPILHKDLKAANVLVRGSQARPDCRKDGTPPVYVAAFECSVGWWELPFAEHLRFPTTGGQGSHNQSGIHIEVWCV